MPSHAGQLSDASLLWEESPTEAYVTGTVHIPCAIIHVPVTDTCPTLLRGRRIRIVKQFPINKLIHELTDLQWAGLDY